MSARHGCIMAVGPTPSPNPTQRQPSPAPKRRRLGRHSFRPATARSKFAGDWKQIGEQSPSNALVAWLAGYSPSSSSYANPRSALKPSGLIEYPSPAPDSARRQFCHCRARPIRFCGGTRTTMKPAFSHSSRSAPGRAQRPAKKKGERYPITYYGIGSNISKWIYAGVDARIHALRHTTGSRTLRKTGNLKVVQTLLGHSTIAITAEFYANVTVEDVRAAMEATTSAAPTELPAIEKKK